MSRSVNRIFIILISVFSPSLLSAQEWVQETRLLVQESQYGEGERERDPLASDLFAYGRFGGYLCLLKGDREVPVLKQRFGVGIGEEIYDVRISRDNSRIVFGSRGATWHFPAAIHSVRPDGSQLRILVKSGDGCGKRGRTGGHGPTQCSFPLRPRLSPDGQWILFFNQVDEWDEESQLNIFRYYLSMIPVTGGPIVRLEEVGSGHDAVWSEDVSSIYYFSSESSNERWKGVPRRYDLETGRSEPLTDASWRALRPLAVSRSDGILYFTSLPNQAGFARLDPETGFAELVSEKLFDSFDLSPDGRRAVGVKGGDLTLINLEFLSSSPLQINPGTTDELGLGQIPTERERWFTQRQRQAPSYAEMRKLPSQARKAIGVEQVRWVDNERLWCVVRGATGTRVGIAQLY